jgi:hypothetical protein
MVFKLIHYFGICSGECLGSSGDEERSELRYALWIAEFRESTGCWTHAATCFTGCISIGVLYLFLVEVCKSLSFMRSICQSARFGLSWQIFNLNRWAQVMRVSISLQRKLYSKTRSEVRLPTEFKHISKWRKTKLQRMPPVMANEQGRARNQHQNLCGSELWYLKCDQRVLTCMSLGKGSMKGESPVHHVMVLS